MKKVLILMVALVTALTLAACGKKNTGRKDESTASITSDISQSESSRPSGQSTGSKVEPESSSTPEESTNEPSEPAEGELVVFDPETDTTTSEVVDAGGDLDAALVDALNDALDFGEYEIRINSVTLENGGLTIDLAEDSVPLVGVGSSGEAACLKSIAVTFLKNYPEAEMVYFTVDGGIYSSGHLEFREGEPYMDRSMMD